MPPRPRGAPERRAAGAKRAGTALQALAARVGIVAEYMDQTGKERRRTSDESRVGLLKAMKIDASSEAAARRALEELDARDRSRLVEPARVVEQETVDCTVLPVTGGEGWPASIDWTLEVVTEEGATRRESGRSSRRRDGRYHLPLPMGLPLGYHTARCTVSMKGREQTGEQLLIVVPSHCPRAGEVLGGQRVFGLTANLYTVRSDRNWGVGDLTDLAGLAQWAGEVGAAFVGVNPLHALRNRGTEISPYSPVSRLYRNHLYIDVEAVPELAESQEARQLMTAGSFLRERDRLRRAARLDYHMVDALKTPILEALHRTFCEKASASRGGRAAAYRTYCKREGETLRDFATFRAIDEWMTARENRAVPWQEWPEELRDPASPAVEQFRRDHGDRVRFHQWLQFEMDTQLAHAQHRAREAGLPIGLYQDLAIGTSSSGSDTWMFPSLFLTGASVGAPPDPLAQEGQNWGLPPIDPRALKEDGYRYWTRLLRSSFRHTGALRMDHVIGLFRQFWIPEGMTGAQGAYVTFPSKELLGILALEATRAGAIVVGEDLGTVPDEVTPALRKWGLLSSRVLYFEREAKGGFKPAGSYEREALSTANTHDLPTLVGFWTRRDVDLRRAVGLISGRDAGTAQRERAEEKDQLVARLATEGIVDPEAPGLTAEHVRTAVHVFLRRTPSWLVGLSLDDVVGESEPVNLPGVSPDKFPSWTRRLGVSLEQIRHGGTARRTLGAERVWIP